MTSTRTMIHPTTGEILPAPRLGVTMWSKTRRYNDDAEYQSPIGGYLIDICTISDDTDDVELTEYRVVDWRFGRSWYWNLQDVDIDWDAYSGGVHMKSVQGVAARLMDDQTKHPKHDHLAALLALSHAVINR